MRGAHPGDPGEGPQTDNQDPPGAGGGWMAGKQGGQAHGPLGIVRPTPNRHRRTTTPNGSESGGERAQESSSSESSSSFVSDWDAASSSSTALLTIFFRMSG